VKTIDEALRFSLPEVAQSVAAKMLTPSPEVAHDKVVLAQA
jgi:hypothetical protein